MDEELLNIPGVGKETKKQLQKLGIYKISDLIGKDPQELYDRECFEKGCKIDRCELYVFRCAVYFAENIEKIKPNEIKWWHFKDNK